MNITETENNRPLKSRNKTFDHMKGFAIISMIAGHLMIIGRDFIYSFHMPLFFILGGYFAKSKPIKKTVGNDFKRLVVPYLIIGVIVVIGEWGLKHNFSTEWIPEGIKMLFWANAVSNHPSYIWGEIGAIGSIWFLFALFWTRNSFNLILKFNNNIYIIGFLCAILASVAILLNRFIICLPFAILTGLSALIFYYVGYFFRQKDVFSKVGNSKIYLLISLLLWIAAIEFSEINIGSMHYNNPVLAVAGAVAAVLVLYYLFSKCNLQILVYFGIVSLTVLCIHKLLTGLYIRDFLFIKHGWQKVLFDIVVCLSLIPLMQQSKLLRDIFGLPKLEVMKFQRLFKRKPKI